MTLTGARLKAIQLEGRLFCDLIVVAYFLGQSVDQATYLYESGRLPKATCPDGSDYRPSGDRLVVAAGLAELLTEERRAEFALWRRGGLEIDRADVRARASRQRKPYEPIDQSLRPLH
jgi:hypothetical protein